MPTELTESKAERCSVFSYSVLRSYVHDFEGIRIWLQRLINAMIAARYRGESIRITIQ